MLRICLAINVIIPIVYMIIYWDTIKDKAKRKEMSRTSKRFLGIGMAISIIALLINMISIYLS